MSFQNHDSKHHDLDTSSDDSSDSDREATVYTCDLCKKNFSRLYNLRQHQNTVGHKAKANQTVVGQTYAQELSDIRKIMEQVNTKVTELSEKLKDKITLQPLKYNLDEIKEILHEQYEKQKKDSVLDDTMKKEFKQHVKNLKELQKQERAKGKLFECTLQEFLNWSGNQK